ncbi:MAG: peptide chain release factor N(5)-glutamine methyltransferase [Candidatus Omnitrophica bacterium]|nr:peptide chain release factor N(5)-glutamine methyltransferase [Candidatus Omnitrophota bacterium]MBU1783952.1 peptide chain release factor N(5)-glutamine methyltransferase [Candidatus Omnitrophota bacterium]
MIREYSETVPVQYEDGIARFMEMDILVDPRVFIPRPETELLIRTVVALCQDRSLLCPRILEVGTGSGIIPLGVTRLLPAAGVLSVDISADALDVAGRNIEKLGTGGIELLQSDMFGSIGAELEGTFDVVISNPPYVSDKDYAEADAWVKAEPMKALRSGAEGMDHLKILAASGGRFLRPGGFISVEIGYDQAGKTKRLFAEKNFTGIKSFFDTNGYERVIAGWKHG